MALLFMDGFDYYSSDQIKKFPYKWAVGGSGEATGANAQTGRNGVGMATVLLGNTNLAHPYPLSVTIIIGFALKLDRGETSDWVRLYGNEWIHLGFGSSIGNKIVVSRGGTTDIAFSDKALPLGVWNHIEIKALISNTVGTVEVRVNNEVWINETGLDTLNGSGPVGTNALQLLGSNTLDSGFDDLYILDTTGSRLNDFIGDCGIETLYPSGVGADAEFTPSAGANWQNVDEVGDPDDDTTYNEDTVAPSTDRHAHDNLSGSPTTVHAVAVNVHSRKTETGPRTMRAVAYDGVTEGESADFYPAYGDYSWWQSLFVDHPSGAAVWTASEVDAGEFGYKLQA